MVRGLDNGSCEGLDSSGSTCDDCPSVMRKIQKKGCNGISFEGHCECDGEEAGWWPCECDGEEDKKRDDNGTLAIVIAFF